MAKRKNLKRDFDYLCNEMKLRTVYCYFIPHVEKETCANLMHRIAVLNMEFRRRIQNPTGTENKSLVKQFYKQLLNEFNVAATEIFAELNELYLKLPEN